MNSLQSKLTDNILCCDRLWLQIAMTSLALVSLVVTTPLLAQSTDTSKAVTTESGMTAEELEAYIAKQRLALEAAQEERAKQIEKRRKIQAALDKKKKQLSDVENEMQQLCDERKELDPDSTEPCLAEES